jgi:hypothetical protein
MTSPLPATIDVSDYVYGEKAEECIYEKQTELFHIGSVSRSSKSNPTFYHQPHYQTVLIVVPFIAPCESPEESVECRASCYAWLCNRYVTVLQGTNAGHYVAHLYNPGGGGYICDDAHVRSASKLRRPAYAAPYMAMYTRRKEQVLTPWLPASHCAVAASQTQPPRLP